MRRVKKTIKWLGFSLGVVILVALSALAVGKYYISHDDLKERAISYLSAKVGGEVTFESIDLYFIPGPRIYIKGGYFDIPGKAEGKFESITFYPKLLPLLIGDLDVSKIRLVAPYLKTDLSVYSKDPEERQTMIGSIDYNDLLKRLFDYLNEHEQGLNAKIERGNIVLKNKSLELLSLYNINASVSQLDDSLNINLSSDSNIFNKFMLKIHINTANYDGSGEIKFNNLNLQNISRSYFPDKLMVSDSSINMSANFSTRNLSVIKGSFNSRVSKVTLIKNDSYLDVSIDSLLGDFYFDDNKSYLEIKDSKLGYPDVTVSGKFERNNNSGYMTLDMTGTDVDVLSARASTLFVVGGHKVADVVFDVIRGGMVPHVTVSAAGNTLKHMWKEENFVVKGNMVNGSIMIPKVNFLIEDARGYVEIKDGYLMGENLSGRMGNSVGYDGSLELRIEGPGTLKVETMIDADLSEVPPILEQFIKDKVFLRELSYVNNIVGKGTGKLVLGDTKDGLKPDIKIDGYTLSAGYKRTPYAISIEGGKFNYTDKIIGVEDTKIAAGKFSVSNITSEFNWNDDFLLNMTLDNTQVDLGQMIPWLAAFDKLNPYLKHVSSISGLLTLSALDYDGPVLRPEEWKINAKGDVKAVNMKIDQFSENVIVESGTLAATPEAIYISDAAVGVNDSALVVNATLMSYLNGSVDLEATFSGTVAPKTSEIISNYTRLPPELKLPTPISVTDSTFIIKPSNGSSDNSSQSKSTGSQSGMRLDMNLLTEQVEWADVPSEVSQSNTSSKTEPTDSNWSSPIEGTINVQTTGFIYNNLKWDLVKGVVGIFGDRVDVTINEANLCGISTPGNARISLPNLDLTFDPFSENEDINEAITCLFDKTGFVEGSYDFKADIKSSSLITDYLSSLEGDIEVYSEKGHVNSYGAVAKFFSYLNFGELIRGSNPDFSENGFPYHSLSVKAYVKEGKVMITEGVMDGPSLKIVCEGYIDLIAKTMDLNVMVIPVMAVDSVIEKIPFVRSVFSDKYVSIPVSVKGSYSDPTISELSAYTIRSGLLGIIRQTLNIPVTIVKPLNYKEQEEAEVKEDEVINSEKQVQ